MVRVPAKGTVMGNRSAEITLAERLRLFWWNWVRRPLINAAWRLTRRFL